MTAQQRLQRIEQRATVDIIRMGISEVADVRFFAKEMNHRLADLVNLARELTEENKQLREALRHIERTGTVSSKRIAREALKENR